MWVERKYCGSNKCTNMAHKRNEAIKYGKHSRACSQFCMLMGTATSKTSLPIDTTDRMKLSEALFLGMHFKGKL